MGNDNSREYRVKGAGTNLKGSVDDFAQRNDKYNEITNNINNITNTTQRSAS